MSKLCYFKFLKGLFKQINAVETIMYAAEKLKIALEAKYLAIELFDRYARIVITLYKLYRNLILEILVCSISSHPIFWVKILKLNMLWVSPIWFTHRAPLVKGCAVTLNEV